MKIKLKILRNGSVQLLRNDKAKFLDKFFERIKVTRVSHIEPNADDTAWRVISAKTGRIIKDGFKTRRAALAFEKKYYNIDGPGWKEIEDECQPNYNHTPTRLD